MGRRNQADLDRMDQEDLAALADPTRWAHPVAGFVKRLTPRRSSSPDTIEHGIIIPLWGWDVRLDDGRIERFTSAAEAHAAGWVLG